MKEVRLTHGGLSRLGSNPDFELKTDNQKDTINCSRSMISFISPVIHKLLIDPTINELRLLTANSSRCSGNLRALLDGNTASAADGLAHIIYSIVAELGNEELSYCIGEDLTLENVIIILEKRHLRSVNIASHLYELSKEKIDLLDISVIESINISEFLVIESEKSLLEYIKSLINIRDDYRSLLCQFHLEYLEANDISYIIDSIDVDNIGSFLPRIFDRLIFPFSKFEIN